jgi:hypothetical protein
LRRRSIEYLLGTMLYFHEQIGWSFFLGFHLICVDYVYVLVGEVLGLVIDYSVHVQLVLSNLVFLYFGFSLVALCFIV